VAIELISQLRAVRQRGAPAPAGTPEWEGLWFAFLDRANTITVTLARGDNRTALYLRAGFGY